MTTEEAIKFAHHAQGMTVITEVQEFYKIAEAALRAQQEAGRYRFYYCESEDSYLLGARMDNLYYAHWDGKQFVWDMSRYLPWGEHVVRPDTAWKEHTFPSEPKEISPEKWFQGFLAKLNEESKENKPLTLEELRRMDGEPVWLANLCEDFDDGWYIVVAVDKNRIHCLQLYAMLFFEHYGKTWLAYRNKPKKGA